MQQKVRNGKLYATQVSAVVVHFFCPKKGIGEYMDKAQRVKEIRESTGMNRRQFCEYFKIPYQTVTDWELDHRHAPTYVIDLLEYYVKNEGLSK